MDFTWYESLVYGLVSGLSDILPVSAQAHRQLLLKLFGADSDMSMMRLFIHLGVFAAVLFHCQPHITRLLRAKRLSRVPKRRRKRPLDTKSLMDHSLWKTMLVPVILSFFLYEKASKLQSSLLWMSIFVLINGLILYIPQFFPGSNKDSRMLSRVEGLLMGLGGFLGILPGISAVGASVSIASICGLERSYAFTMTLLMNLGINLGLIVMDAISVVNTGLFGYSFSMLANCVMAGIAALLGTYLGIRTVKHITQDKGYGIFAYYCWGVALFTFVINLMA